MVGSKKIDKYGIENSIGTLFDSISSSELVRFDYQAL